jgi:hypothetical protein
MRTQEFNQNFNKIRGLGDFALAFKEELHQKAREQFSNLHRTDEGIQELIRIYSPKTYPQKAEMLGLKLEPDIESILNVQDSYYYVQNPVPFHLKLWTDSLSDARKSQIQSLKSIMPGEWGNKVATGAIMGEEIVCQYALEKKLPLKRISESDQYNKVDCEIKNSKIDVKTRIRIGAKLDLALLKKRWDNEEIVILTSVGVKNFSSQEFSGSIIGVLDKKLITSNGLIHILEECSWITEPFFVDLDRYFGLEKRKEWPQLNLRSFNFHLKENRLTALRGHFGEVNFLKGLNISGKYRQYQDLILALIGLHDRDAGLLSALVVFDWLLKKIRHTKMIDVQDLKNVIIDQLTLTLHQRRYLEALLRGISGLTERNCKFTGLPLNSGVILFKGGILSSTISGYTNVLFAYSRYGGDLLTILDSRICDDPGCACLLHDTTNLTYGKGSCPQYGIARDIKLKGKNL